MDFIWIFEILAVLKTYYPVWKFSNISSTISRRNWDDPKVPRGPRRRVGALCQIWQESEISNLRFQWRFWNVVFFQRISTKIETKSHFQKYWTFLAENPILSKIPFYLEKPSKVWGKSHFHFFLRFCRFSCQNWGKSKFWNLNFENHYRPW